MDDQARRGSNADVDSLGTDAARTALGMWDAAPTATTSVSAEPARVSAGHGPEVAGSIGQAPSGPEPLSVHGDAPSARSLSAPASSSVHLRCELRGLERLQ